MIGNIVQMNSKFCFHSNIIVYTLCSRLHNDTLNTLSVDVGGTSDTIISRDPNALSYINQLCKNTMLF